MAGMGLVQVVRGLNTGFGAVSTSEDHSEAFNPLGATVMLDDGRGFRYLKINQIGAVGQIVTPLLSIDDADVDAASSDATLTGTDDFILNEFADGSAFVFINAGTGLGQVRRIRSNTANVLTVDSAWSTALDTTSDYVTFAPYEVELCDATFERVVGVELSAHTADYYGWFQISGLALDTTSDYVTFAPYEVELCDATFERVVGVELSAHTADYYGWFQISGLA